MSFTVWVRYSTQNILPTLRDTIVIQHGLRNRTGVCPKKTSYELLNVRAHMSFGNTAPTLISVCEKWHNVSICVVCPVSCVISIVTSEGNGQRSKQHTSLAVDNTQKAVYQSLHFLIKCSYYFTTQQQVSAVGPMLFLAELETLTRLCANQRNARVRFYKILRGHPGTVTFILTHWGTFQGTVSI